MVVSVETEPVFKPGKPEILFHSDYSFIISFSTADRHPWDMSPDGKRFLMMRELKPSGDSSTGAGPRKINIVLNWTEELKQRVPVK